MLKHMCVTYDSHLDSFTLNRVSGLVCSVVLNASSIISKQKINRKCRIFILMKILFGMKIVPIQSRISFQIVINFNYVTRYYKFILFANNCKCILGIGLLNYDLSDILRE